MQSPLDSSLKRVHSRHENKGDTHMQLTHQMALDYAAKTLPGMCRDAFRILGARDGEDGTVVVTFQESDSGERVQCFDVWIEDMGDGPVVYGEW